MDSPNLGCWYFCWIHANTNCRDNKAKELVTGNVEFAVLEFAEYVCIGKKFEDLFNMELVLFWGLGIYQDVVNVNDKEDIKVLSENDVAETLK